MITEKWKVWQPFLVPSLQFTTYRVTCYLWAIHRNTFRHTMSRILDPDFENTAFMTGISLSVTWQMNGFVLSVITSGLAMTGINPVVNTFEYFETLNTHRALMTDQCASVIYLWKLRTLLARTPIMYHKVRQTINAVDRANENGRALILQRNFQVLDNRCIFKRLLPK